MGNSLARQFRYSLILAILALAGCGDYSAPTKGYNGCSPASGSCVVTSGTCEDFVGSGWTATTAQANCGGSYSSQPCGVQGTAGSCSTGTSLTQIVTWYTTNQSSACIAAAGIWTQSLACPGPAQ